MHPEITQHCWNFLNHCYPHVLRKCSTIPRSSVFSLSFVLPLSSYPFFPLLLASSSLYLLSASSCLLLWIIWKLTNCKHHQTHRKYITAYGVVFVEDFWSHIRTSASICFHVLLVRSLELLVRSSRC